MFKVQSLIEVKDFNDIVNLLNYFINRNDLKFYEIIIETNESGEFRIYRDLESIYIEQEKFINGCRIVNTGKFKNLDDATPFIKIYKNDIILEVEIKITVNQIEEINNVLNEIKKFEPIALQVITETVIYEEFRN